MRIRQQRGIQLWHGIQLQLLLVLMNFHNSLQDKFSWRNLLFNCNSIISHLALYKPCNVYNYLSNRKLVVNNIRRKAQP